jgi:pyrroline-5-carboxylate reductase
MKVLVLGAGKMTEAILMGFKKNTNLSEWMIYSPTGVSASKLAGKVGARSVPDLALVKNVDWILVGCKPQQLKELSATLDGRFKESLFVSMVAAVSEEDQLRILGGKELIRIMPNLPVEYNEGICLLSSLTAKGRLSSFQTLFEKLGTSFTSLDEAQREKLVRQVMKGSSLSAQNSKLSLAEMTEAVTSKAGVTIAVLNEWRESKFSQFVKKGIEAGRKRTEEIKSLLRN